jgi:hypothetical protein
MSARDRAVLTVVCVVAVVLAPWLLVIQPKRDQAAKLQTQVNAGQAQLSTARATLAAGAASRAAFATSYTTLVRLGEAVPTDDNTPSLIYQLQAAAKATGVDFQSLTLSAASASSAAPTAGSAAQASTATLPPGVTVGPAGFPIEPFTFIFQGSFFHLADFFGRLQRFVVANNKNLSVSGRLMTLNAISMTSAGFPHITATVSATTYLLPAAEGLLNGATPAGPSATTQPVSTPSSTSPPPPAVVTPPVR